MTHEKIEAAKELAAGLGTAGSWTLWGISLATLNEVLQAVSLFAATCASIAAFVYYRKKSK